MSYRKFKADFLFDGFTMHPGSDVLICREDGVVESIVDEVQAGGDIEKYNGMLSPGFINCHCHLELSHLKGHVPEKQGLVNFLFSVVTERYNEEEKILAAIASAEAAMLDSGIVGVGDICNTANTISQKTGNHLRYYNFIELIGWSPARAVSSYEAAATLGLTFLSKTEDNIHWSLNPHAPYSVSSELWNLISPHFHGKTITIHNQEAAAENEFFIDGSGDLNRLYSLLKLETAHFTPPGKNSLPCYLPNLKPAAGVLLVHNTVSSESDIEEAVSFHGNLFFCLCPNANIYIEDELPDIPLFLKHNAKIVLGTDSLASNKQLSILEEMKTIKKSFPAIPTADLLLWATSNGAKILSFDESLGDFGKGKRPGVVLIEETEGGEISGSSRSRRLV
jgi:aminodeoxyfutalosine deaminase